jgi:hypothetical protein
MPIVLLLECRTVYDVNARIVCVEKSRDEYIGGGLRWELRQYFGFGG